MKKQESPGFSRGEHVNDTTTLETLADQILRRAITIAHGDTAEPRPGQAELTSWIAEAMGDATDEPGGEPPAVIAEAPTGIGKSFAGLAPAFAAAAHRKRRTVISTEMVGLQNQIMVKDAPVVAQACAEVTGYTPKIAVHKGWRRYVCLKAAFEQAIDLLGE